MNLTALHHLAFAVTDLDETERFARDFGLHRVSNDGGTLYMSTAGGDAYCYVARQADARGFLGLAFVAEAMADLEEAVARHGATPVRALNGPGGGHAVTLTSPDGFKVDIVTGITGREPMAPPAELRLNTPVNPTRYQVPQSGRPLGPAHLFRLGHTGLYVKDCKVAMDWFEQTLGLRVSDAMHLPGQPDKLVAAFMRLDRGEEYVDHHCVFLAGFGLSDCHHISFEAMDFEAQCRSHRWLGDRGWDLCWGVGRHPLGCHVFDVWFDPDRYRFESYTDTDLVNNSHKPGHYDVSKSEMDIWRSDPPDRYFEVFPANLSERANTDSREQEA